MRNRYIIAVDDATTEGRNAFTKWLKESPHGYWHHITTMWIVTDTRREMTVSEWREKAYEFMPGATVFVLKFEAHHSTWSARAPKTSFEWLHKYMKD